jgi:hypothetical protein
MVEHRSNTTKAAFTQLIKAIQREITSSQQAGHAAGAAGSYQIASQFFDRASKLQAILDGVRSTRRQWQRIRVPRSDAGSRTRRSPVDRLPRGARTPESAFELPILETLADLGGAGPVKEVLDQVGERMRPILKPVDRQPLSSDPRQERWRNTARWARRELVRRDLLDRSAPRGIWRLTDLGRRYLAEARGDDATKAPLGSTRELTQS